MKLINFQGSSTLLIPQLAAPDARNPVEVGTQTRIQV